MFEIGAVITTLLCVYLLNRKKTLGWLFGIFGAALFFIVFIQEDLLFQSGLQVVYLAQSVYGWWSWKKEDKKKPKMMDNWIVAIAIVEVLVISAVLVSIIPSLSGLGAFLDVLTTLLALLATYYLSKKIIQSWYLWVLINILMLALFILQGLWIATGMEIILLIIAINASINWTKEFKYEKV